MKIGFEKLMREIQSGISGYSRFDCGEQMLYLMSCNDRQKLLVDVKNKKVIELVDRYGRMVAFAHKDVRKSLIDRDSTGCAGALLAKYRFFVREFRGGKAAVEWTICPDGRYFADEDGFGAEDCEELTAVGAINREGKVVVQFH